MNVQLRPKSVYDEAPLRAQFDILARQVYGKPLVYLDNAASAQKPRAVMAAMAQFAANDYANVHRGVHYLSAAATHHYEAAREATRGFINAAHVDEIVFTKGGTEAINLVASSWLAPHIRPGDEIVLTTMEHHSNIVPWHFLRERQGAVLRWVDVEDDGALASAALDAAIGPQTRLVAIAHMSNVLGTVTPLREIVRCAHAKGVPVLADGCQAAVHEIVDVQDLDVDFYALTGHKLYGPTGIGALYAKRAHLHAMRPFNGGGEMIAEVTRDQISYAEPPARFEAGTPPIIEFESAWLPRSAGSRRSTAMGWPPMRGRSLPTRPRKSRSWTGRASSERRRARERYSLSRRRGCMRMMSPPYWIGRASPFARGIIARSL